MGKIEPLPNHVKLHLIAKTPWSWGRMHGILSEGREIDPRCQLEPAIALRSKREERIGNKTGTPARERPLTRAWARLGLESILSS